MMDDLPILIARLGWPTVSARWWTMQELATRLGDPSKKKATEAALLEQLRSRRLEAEVVETLCVFWMAAKRHGYTPAEELAGSVSKPSLLSDLFLGDLGLEVPAIDAGLMAAPKDFEIPDDFEGVHGIDLPRIFRTNLNRLVKHTRLPFLRQMAFEWTQNRAAYPEAPYQGDLWHFTRPLGDGFSGQTSARSALRSISAYLRTLAVAEKLWKMPSALAYLEALLALPVHPTLAFLKPQRPNWFPDSADFKGDVPAIEASIQAMIARVKAAHPDRELLAFSSPVLMSMERCVEVTLVRWSQVPGTQVNESALANYLSDFWNGEWSVDSEADDPLSTTTVLTPLPLEELMNNEAKAWPLAAPLDLNRLGYLQLDLYPSRIYLPTLPGVGTAELAARGGGLDVKVQEQVVAQFSYWNVGWGPARPRRLGGNCGTALVSRAEVSSENRTFYLWQVRTLHRTNTFDRFGETVVTGTFRPTRCEHLQRPCRS
jgi:hypothetical protein